MEEQSNQQSNYEYFVDNLKRYKIERKDIDDLYQYLIKPFLYDDNGNIIPKNKSILQSALQDSTILPLISSLTTSFLTSDKFDWFLKKLPTYSIPYFGKMLSYVTQEHSSTFSSHLAIVANLGFGFKSVFSKSALSDALKDTLRQVMVEDYFNNDNKIAMANENILLKKNKIKNKGKEKPDVPTFMANKISQLTNSSISSSISFLSNTFSIISNYRIIYALGSTNLMLAIAALSTLAVASKIAQEMYNQNRARMSAFHERQIVNEIRKLSNNKI